jgi:glucuronoarabinoxylan endo-1,4-beta-xylanase
MIAIFHDFSRSRHGVLMGWLVFFLGVVGAGAQNLAVNPGFETGDTTGWFAFGSPTISVESAAVHTGSFAGLVTNRTASYMGIAQSLAGVLQTNETYTISVWVQLVNGASQTMQLTAQKIDGSGTSYADIGSATVSAGNWTQLVGEYTLNVSNTLTGLALYVEAPSSTNAAYYVDDLLVESMNVAATNGQCTVVWTNVFQRIDGFGASSAWDGYWTSAQADMFFSTNSGTGTSFDGRTNFAFAGAGLSLLRNHIAYANSTTPTAVPGTVETSIMQMAQARGALVWSTPWTPAVGFKDNNGPNGGNYLGSGNNGTNVAYARQLANYVASMKNTYGVNLYALSMQNEPDAQVTSYEACGWTGSQFHDFVTNLAGALVAEGVGATKIILPESQSWAGNPGLYQPTLNDPVTAAVVSIVANHDYVANNGVGDLTTPAGLSVGGKSLWETEVSQIGGGFDGSITNAVYWAGRVHLYLTAAQANAWNYWWLCPGNPDNEGLTDTNGVPAKRLYALGQFARFVRPGFYRIEAPTNTSSLQISAYKNPTNGDFAIVAINAGTAAVTQVFNLAGFSASSVTPWITSGTLSLASQSALRASGGAFTSSVPALSVVTYVGVVTASNSNTPPRLTPIANQIVNAGFTLVLTNLALDTNVPTPVLTFRVLQAPTNAVLNVTNGVFRWRPLVGQAGSTNAVAIQVADNGVPILTATNDFQIRVNPLSAPTVSSLAVTNGLVVLTVAGPAGPDYTLLTSTNLFNWQPVVTSNSPLLPVRWQETNQLGAQRFYRIEIGP